MSNSLLRLRWRSNFPPYKLHLGIYDNDRGGSFLRRTLAMKPPHGFQNQPNLGLGVKDIDTYIKAAETTMNETRSSVLSIVPTDGEETLQLVQSLAKRHTPPIHEEFGATAGALFAETATREMVRKLLYRGYLDAAMSPWLSLMRFIFSSDEDSITVPKSVREEELVSRWRGTAGLILASQEQLKPGDIVDVYKELLDGGYLNLRRSIFINAPLNPLFTTIESSTTHISVGFNDLNEIASLSRNIKGNVRYIGVEQSVFAVARSQVVLAMLLDPAVPLLAVYQVWYSATWTPETLTHFRKTCSHVLRTTALDTTRPFLEWWLNDTPLSVARSREQWFWHFSTSGYGLQSIRVACAYHRGKDRSAIVRYLLTGEAIPAKEGNVGSLIFWNDPPGEEKAMETDSLFNTVWLDIPESTASASEGMHIVRAIFHSKMADLEEFRAALVSGSITVDFLVGELHLENQQLTSTVASYNPTSVSWSNVMDYYSYESFHQLAKRLKADRHYGYSMNWVASTYGANHLDYESRKDKRLWIENLLRLTLRMDHHPVRTLPLCTTAENHLNTKLAQNVMHHWVDYFAEEGGASISDVKIQKEMSIQRATSTLYMTWTYDGGSSQV